MPTPNLVDQANGGVDQLLHSGYIVVTTLTTCMILAIIGNIVQYWMGQKRADKDFERHVAMASAINEMAAAVRETKAIFSFVVDLYKEKQNDSQAD